MSRGERDSVSRDNFNQEPARETPGRFRGDMGRVLAFIGGNGPRALFIGVFIGLAVPPLASLLRPILPHAVAILLVFALLRVDWHIMAGYIRQPIRSGLLVAWMMLISPVVTWLALWPVPLPEALKISVVLMACAPPILGATAIAILLGLDGALVVVIGIVSTLLTPLTVPPLALALLGLELEVGVLELMIRLAALVLGAFLAALLLRRLIGLAKLRSYNTQLDGLMVLTMLIFAISVMDGVTDAIFEDPWMVALWLAVAFVANPVLQLLGWGMFFWMGRRRALSAALMSGNCNMGLLLAALPADTNFGVVLFFAIAQLPMYMLPAILSPVYRRLLGQKPGGAKD